MSGGQRHSCRLCGAGLERTFVDLGVTPLANSYIDADSLGEGETFYPLCVLVCNECFLVQLPVFAAPDVIFDEYAYFSSYSDSWVDHARRYVEAIVERFGFDDSNRVVEVASNDGYLLQFFVERGIPATGIEPSANVAAAAAARGVPTIVDFFGTTLAGQIVREQGRADLVVGNNVLAHVPDLHDFVEGLRTLLAPQGVITMEFPHLLRLIAEKQFDTIYHEHFSYLSLLAVERLFGEHGLRLFDVDELTTHGGSLRIYACLAGADEHGESDSLAAVRAAERDAALDRAAGYDGFEEAVRQVKRDLLGFLLDAKRDGKSIVGYGAAAKGNTLLNYCGIRSDFLDYVVDRNPHKQGCFLPGTHLAVLAPAEIRRTRPDLILVLSWNLAEEIAEQLRDVRDWGCRLVVPIPAVRVLD
jgi:SAM-dependent methyltransferase